MPHLSRIVLLALLASSSGCGEMMFKRGAGPGDMSSAQAACRRATADEAAYVTCMRERGYMIDSGGSSVFVEGTAATAVAEATATAQAPAKSPSPDESSAAPAPGAPAPVVTAPPDPLREIKVTSWWKLGGTPAQLAAAQGACVERLGVRHRPDPQDTRFTAAMIDCLKTQGWYGIGN